MKNLDLKGVLILEVVILVVISLFTLDFLPRNYNEYQRVCSQRWATDAKQFETCMEPYYKQISTDKYSIGAAVVVFIALPVIYSSRNKKYKS